MGHFLNTFVYSICLLFTYNTLHCEIYKTVKYKDDRISYAL